MIILTVTDRLMVSLQYAQTTLAREDANILINSLMGVSQPLIFTLVIFILIPFLILHVTERTRARVVFRKLGIEGDFVLKFLLVAVSARLFLHFLHLFFSGKNISLSITSLCVLWIASRAIELKNVKEILRYLRRKSTVILSASVFLIILVTSLFARQYYVIEGLNHDLQYFYEAVRWFSTSSLLNLNANSFFQNYTAIGEFSGFTSNFSRNGIFSEISYLWPIAPLHQPIYAYLSIAIGIVYYLFAIVTISQPKTTDRSNIFSATILTRLLQTFLLVLTPPSLLMISNANIGSFIAGSILCLNMALLISRPMRKIYIQLALNLALIMHVYPEVALIQLGIILIFTLVITYKETKSTISIREIVAFALVFALASNTALVNGIQSWYSALNTGPNVSSPIFFFDKPYLWILSAFSTINLSQSPITSLWQLMFVLTLFFTVSFIIWKKSILRCAFISIVTMGFILFTYAKLNNQQYFEVKIIQYLGILVWFLLITKVYSIPRKDKQRILYISSVLSAVIVFSSSSFLFAQDFRFFLINKSMKVDFFSLITESPINFQKIIFDDSLLDSQQDFQTINYLLTELVASNNEVFMPSLEYNSLRGAYFNKQLDGNLSSSIDAGELISIRKGTRPSLRVNNQFEESRSAGDLVVNTFGENSHFVLFGSGFQSCNRYSCSFSENVELLIFVGKESSTSNIRLTIDNRGGGSICRITSFGNRDRSCMVNKEIVTASLFSGWNKLAIKDDQGASSVYRIRSIEFENR